MSNVILIPGILFILALFRDSLQKAFFNVYVPVFVCFPIYYTWKVAALPPISWLQAVAIPLGIVLLIKEWRNWRFSLMDLCVVFFIYSAGHADELNNQATASTFEYFIGITDALVPYMAGKLLIEKDQGRIPFLRRTLFCLFLTCILSAYEYRMGRNPFMMLAGPIFPDEHFAWKTQIRWHFGRVSGPYGQSELAGMIFFTGIIFALYLNFYNTWEPKFRNFAWLPWLKSQWITWTIILTLLMTQARGPWIGAVAAIPIALIGRSERVLRRAIMTGLVLLVVGAVVYTAFKIYTTSPAQSAEQETATYRASLISNYLPEALHGGPWGWGPKFQRIGGQDSVDNEYLFVTLTQGWVGLASVTLLALQSLYNFTWAAIFNARREDRYFAFSLLGIYIGMLLTIYTVFLGNQPYMLFFLLAGWSQAIRDRRQERPSFAFAQVYT
jgi:hypothetical protein